MVVSSYNNSSMLEFLLYARIITFHDNQNREKRATELQKKTLTEFITCSAVLPACCFCDVTAIHQNDEPDMEDERIKSPFGSSFRTFDGTDYSNIATIDVKKNIFDMCTDMSDLYIAVVEVSRRRHRRRRVRLAAHL